MRSWTHKPSPSKMPPCPTARSTRTGSKTERPRGERRERISLVRTLMYLKTGHTLEAYIRTAPKGDGKNETVQAFAAQIIPGRSHTPTWHCVRATRLAPKRLGWRNCVCVQGANGRNDPHSGSKKADPYTRTGTTKQTPRRR